MTRRWKGKNERWMQKLTVCNSLIFFISYAEKKKSFFGLCSGLNLLDFLGLVLAQ